ncbi:MAG: hypothetical protein EA379_09575 [Phycisphaerales bacterium]|nr:MAG: hypothetical protein EA379_09575 [Phycisphaerales bacterium]
MSSHELSEWAAFVRVEGPFGEERADVRIAQLCALVQNLLSGKRSRLARITDFLLFGDRGGRGRREKATPERVRGLFRLATAGGRKG